MMQAWTYQPWVQEAINKRLNKLADVTQPTIGFHVRGGDKLAEDKMLVGRASAHRACKLHSNFWSSHASILTARCG